MSKNIDEFAKLLKRFENQKPPNIVFGTVLSVEPPQIKLSDKNVILNEVNIKSLIDLREKEHINETYVYRYLNKSVALVTYLNNTKYLVLGVSY